MLRHPFANKQKNIPIYLGFSVCTAVVLSVLWLLTIHYEHFDNSDTWPVPAKFVTYCVVAVLVSFFLASITSILYALKHLCREGISRQSRTTVVVRHALSIIAFTLGQLYMLLCFGSVLNFTNQIFTSSYSVFFQISCLLFAAQGIYVPFLRISEKYFFKVVS